MDTDALKKARDQVADLEAQMLEEIREKAALLGISLGERIEPKPRRKRRTRFEIEAENAKQ